MHIWVLSFLFCFNNILEFFIKNIQQRHERRYPSGHARQELLNYARSCEQSLTLGEFLHRNYGAALMVRVVIDRLIEEYVTMVTTAARSRQQGITIADPNATSKWPGRRLLPYAERSPPPLDSSADVLGCPHARLDHGHTGEPDIRLRIKLVDATSVITRTGEPLQTDLLFAPIREILRDVSVLATPYQQPYRTEGVEIDLRLVADSRPNAFADIDVNRCINVNVGLLLSFCQMQQIPWKLNKLIMNNSRRSINAVAEPLVCRMVEPWIVGSIDELLTAWHDSAQSNWEMLPVDDTLVQNKPWSFSSSFLYQEILIIVIVRARASAREIVSPRS